MNYPPMDPKQQNLLKRLFALMDSKTYFFRDFLSSKNFFAGKESHHRIDLILFSIFSLYFQTTEYIRTQEISDQRQELLIDVFADLTGYYATECIALYTPELNSYGLEILESRFAAYGTAIANDQSTVTALHYFMTEGWERNRNGEFGNRPLGDFTGYNVVDVMIDDDFCQMANAIAQEALFYGLLGKIPQFVKELQKDAAVMQELNRKTSFL